MKKYICILVGAASVLAACEQKTETVNPPSQEKKETNTTIVNPRAGDDKQDGDEHDNYCAFAGGVGHAIINSAVCKVFPEAIRGRLCLWLVIPSEVEGSRCDSLKETVIGILG